MSYAEKIIAVVVSGAPAYFSALADMTWMRVARGTGSGLDGGATIYQVRPSPLPSGISPSPYVFSYSGGCVDQVRGELIIGGGGHGDYAGNELYAIGFRAPTPGYSRLLEPSSGCFSPGTQTHGGTGQYAIDHGKCGAPASSHTANNIVFARDKIWLPQLWGMFPNATGTPRIFWCDRDQPRWHAGTYWRPPAKTSAGQFESQPSFYIALDDAIITGASTFVSPPVSNMAKIDAKTGAVLKTWTDVDIYPCMQAAKAVAIPGTRLAVLICPYQSQLQVWDFASDPPTLSNAAVTDNTGGANWRSEVTGAAFHAASNAIVCGLGGGEDIVAINVPSNPKTGPWVARKVTPANVSDPERIVPPTSSYVYGRFNIIDAMGDGRAALVYQPSDSNAAAYVMPLPAGGIS